MNREWSEKNKEVQALLSKAATFASGIEKLVAFRGELFEQVEQIDANYPAEAFWQMPFAGADGLHSKTLDYSVWHIFRIEDIVAHEMIAGDRQVFFERGFCDAVRSPIITTGNELSGEAIADFSRQLDHRQLILYAREVMQSTNGILQRLAYSDLKRRFGDDMREKLRATGCVSDDERARWLIDYWCGKDVKGLILMPFSRHWIMHIEAMCRIKNRLCKLARKGADPVAYCGLSCNHCFLGQWCGGCRTAYNACSFATCSPDGACPNAKCCREKGIDGCWECDRLETCEVGFYTPANDGAAAAKAHSVYIRRHGKKAFLAVQNRLHERYDFEKTQEILGQDRLEGLRILEEN